MAQLSGLLDGYAVRPSWNVAGGDYAVGVPAGTVLKDPTSINLSGTTVDAANHAVHIKGDNVTLSGYDFSGGGGWTVYVDSGTNVTVQNSNFLVGSNHQDPIFVSAPASNVSILNNVIDGAGQLNYSIGQGLIEGDGTGNVTIEYNVIKNAYSENIVWGNNTPGAPQSINIQYNLVQNAGLGFSQGAHGDWIQLVNGPGANTDSVQINYNTWMQTVPIAEGRTQGLSLYSANSGADSGCVHTEAVHNNTFIVTPGGQAGAYVNYAILVDTSRLMGTGTIDNNYFDPTGIGTPGYGGNWDWIGSNPNGGPYSGAVTASNNVDMRTGTFIGTSTEAQQAVGPASTVTGPPATSATPSATDLSAARTFASVPHSPAVAADPSSTIDPVVDGRPSPSSGVFGADTSNSPRGTWDSVNSILTDATHMLTSVSSGGRPAIFADLSSDTHMLGTPDSAEHLVSTSRFQSSASADATAFSSHDRGDVVSHAGVLESGLSGGAQEFLRSNLHEGGSVASDLSSRFDTTPAEVKFGGFAGDGPDNVHRELGAATALANLSEGAEHFATSSDTFAHLGAPPSETREGTRGGQSSDYVPTAPNVSSFAGALISNRAEIVTDLPAGSDGLNAGHAAAADWAGGRNVTGDWRGEQLAGAAHSDTLVFAPGFGSNLSQSIAPERAAQVPSELNSSMFDTMATILAHAAGPSHEMLDSDTIALKSMKAVVSDSHDWCLG